MALKAQGLSLAREQDAGTLMVVIHLEGGARLFCALPNDQEEALYNLPRLPMPPGRRTLQ